MVTTITPTNVTSSASYLTYIYKKKADVSLIFWPSIDRVLDKFSPLLKILLILCPVGTGDVLQTIGSVIFMEHTSQIFTNTVCFTECIWKSR